MNPWTVFDYDGNLSIQYDGQKHIFGDVDSTRLTPLMRRILRSTLSWKSPKGYGFVLLGPVGKNYYDALHALRCIDLFRDKRGSWLWEHAGEKELRFGRLIRRRLKANGMRDNMPLHGIFRDMDTLTYVLVPPSVTCRYQGKNGVPVNKHSSVIPFCNSGSPDKNHHFFTRKFYNFVPSNSDLLSFDEFMSLILK